MNVNVEDFGNCCRFCLLIVQTKTLRPLFGACLAEMAMELLAMEIYETDGYPQQACISCIRKLSSAYSFKQMACSNHIVLSDILKAATVEEQSNFMQHEHLVLESLALQCDDEDESNMLAVNLSDIRYDEEDTTDISLLLNKQPFYQNPESTISNDKHFLGEGKVEDVNRSVLNQDTNPAKEALSSGNSDHLTDFHVDCIKATADGEFKCTYCKLKYCDKPSLKEHLKSHQECCNVCNKMVTKSSITRHLKTHATDKPFVCNICGCDFAESGNLTKHMKKHKRKRASTEKRIFNLCTYCGKRFKWRSSLTKHVKTHTGRNMHQCHYCSKLFTDFSYLKIHLLSHEARKPFSCKECGKKFSQSSSLYKHQRLIHVATRRKHKCSHCGRIFLRADTLKIHIKKSHGEWKAHLCSQCGKSFANLKLLQGHQQNHKQSSSLYISKTTEELKKLVAENKKNDNPLYRSVKMPEYISDAISFDYFCTKCNANFKTWLELELHSATCSIGESASNEEIIEITTFQCRICEQEYTMDLLMEHFRVAHNILVVVEDQSGSVALVEQLLIRPEPS